MLPSTPTRAIPHVLQLHPFLAPVPTGPAGWLKELLAVGPFAGDALPAAAPAWQPLRAGTSGGTR